MHRRLTAIFRCFGTTYWDCPLKMELIGLTEKSVNIYISTQRNIPEEGKSDLHLGRSLKSCIMLGITTDTRDSSKKWTSIITVRMKVVNKRFCVKNWQVYM